MPDMMNSSVLSNLLQTPPYVPNPPETGGVPALSAIREIDRPIEERLKYGTSFHAEILSRLNSRQLLAENNIKNRWDDWRRVDESTSLYIDLARNARFGDKRSSQNKKEMPWERAIVVPMSYAILQTYLTQMMAIFTRRDPIMEVQGVSEDDIRPAKIMEAVMAYDQQQTNFLVQLFTVCQDAVKYGLGIFYDCWEEEYGWKFTKQPPNPMMDFLGTPAVERTWDVLRQYNQVEAVDPRLAWVDPRVSMANSQRAEFAGHRVYCAYLDILERSQANGGPYFNTEYVSKLGAGITRRDTTVARSLRHLQMTGSMDQNDKGFHAKDVMSIRLIPKDWKLSDGERPEIWQFVWTDKTIIIRAHQSEYWHQMLPYSAAESNVDTHVTFNPGSIENLDGLQRFMDWFYNSYAQNQMRHLNNSMVYSPALVEELDILNPTAAGHYRLSAIGEKLLQEGRITMDGVMHQMQLHDVAAPMLSNVNFLYDMGMRMTGASDAMQAQVTQDKRTLGEINQANLGGSARMGFYAQLIDSMAMMPLGRRWISNRQQFTDKEQFFRIRGDLSREIGSERLLVSPNDLAGSFDYVPRAGPMPPDPAEMAQSWQMVGDMLSKNPALLGIPDAQGRVPDPQELFKEAVRTIGVRNIDSYYKPLAPLPGMPGQMPGGPPPQAGPVRVVPDEQVAQMRQAGNVIPLRGAA